MPPPRILSTSPLCSETRTSPEAEMSRSCTGRRRSPEGAAERGAAARLSRGCSTMVFHSPQAGQRPIHFGLSLPHEVQNHTVLTFPAIYQFSSASKVMMRSMMKFILEEGTTVLLVMIEKTMVFSGFPSEERI